MEGGEYVHIAFCTCIICLESPVEEVVLGKYTEHLCVSTLGCLFYLVAIATQERADLQT